MKVEDALVQIIVEKGPGFYFISCISLVFHVLSATGKTTTQKLSKIRRACDATEAVEVVINVFNKFAFARHLLYIHVT